MRLAVFHYPLQGWIDAVVDERADGPRQPCIQLDELARVSYQPLAETFRAILPRERRHMELGDRRPAQRSPPTDDGRAAARAAIAYWQPRVADSFGTASSARFDTRSRFGLRHRPNEALLADWQAEVARR